MGGTVLSWAWTRLHEVDTKRKGIHMAGYSTARLDEIEEMNDNRCPWRPVRHHFGITSFGANAWTGRNAGDRIINEHDEAEGPDGQEELYVVMSGRARFEIDGDAVDAPAGTFVYAEPSAKRTAFAEEPETTILCLGGTPGKAYEVMGWEIAAPMMALYREGRYAEAAEQGRALLDGEEPHAAMIYNVACCESMAGETELALVHLRQALELNGDLRGLATGDSDLDPIRQAPGFEEMMAAGS